MSGERLQSRRQEHETGLGADVSAVAQHPVHRVEAIEGENGEQYPDCDHRHHQDRRADQHRARLALQDVCRTVDGANDDALCTSQARHLCRTRRGASRARHRRWRNCP